MGLPANSNMKPSHPTHSTAHRAWKYAMKRKLLSLVSAGLIAVAGVAACDVYGWAKRTYELHKANAVAVPFLSREVADLRADMNAMQNYTNSDCWRWRRQYNVNTNLQQQIDKKRNK